MLAQIAGLSKKQLYCTQIHSQHISINAKDAVIRLWKANGKKQNQKLKNKAMQKTFLNNGRLIIPSGGPAPRLFLEWVAQQRVKLQITVLGRYCKEGSTKIHDFYDETYYEVLCISVEGGKPESLISAKQYINDNNR